MRFEYHVITSRNGLSDRIGVQIWLMHSTGNERLGNLEFEDQATFELWKISMQWTPMHVLVEGAHF